MSAPLNPALSKSESRAFNISFNVIICHKQHQNENESFDDDVFLPPLCQSPPPPASNS